MPKFLKFVFDASAFIMTLALPVLMIPTLLILFVLNALLRIPTMIIEFFALRSYVDNAHLKKTIFTMNLYALFSLMPFLFLAIVAVEAVAFYKMPTFLIYSTGLLLIVLLALCEVYIKRDFIKKYATNLHEATKRLCFIVLPFWILCCIVVPRLLVAALDNYFN